MTGLKNTVLVGIAVQSDAGAGLPPDKNVNADNGTADDNGVPYLNESNTSVLRVSHVGNFATAFPSPKVQLSFVRQGSNIVLTWSDATYKLQSTTTLGGVWLDETGASPVNVTPAAGQKFYRLKK